MVGYQLDDEPNLYIGNGWMFHQTSIYKYGCLGFQAVSKWLGSPPFISHEVRPFVRGPATRSLGDEHDHHGEKTMHLLNGMILQALFFKIDVLGRGPPNM